MDTTNRKKLIHEVLDYDKSINQRAFNATTKQVKKWDDENPGRVESIYNAMQNIHPSHMLDRNIFDFHSLLSESMVTKGVKIEA